MAPSVQRLSRQQPIEDFISVLKTDGCVVISDFTSADAVSKANAEIRPHLDAQSEGYKVGGKSITTSRPL